MLLKIISMALRLPLKNILPSSNYFRSKRREASIKFRRLQSLIKARLVGERGFKKEPIGQSRESLPKGKAQYHSPPHANYFR